MPFTPRTLDQITQSLRDRISQTFPELDTSEGTITRIALIDPFSSEIATLESLLTNVQSSFYVLTAKGVDLDLKAFDYNVQRRGAQQASGYVQIYITRSNLTEPIVIPKGTTIRSKANVVYTTLIDAVLNGFGEQQKIRNSVPVYEITVPVICSVVGNIGNANSGLLTTIAINNLNVINDSIISGGFDEETDDSLAARIILSFGVWSRGTKEAVEFGARTVSGVFYALAVRDYPGHFNIYVSDVSGILSDQMTADVDAAMVEWAAAGVAWTILSPPVYLLNTTIRVKFLTTVDQSNKLSQFQSDVSTVINSNTLSYFNLNDLYTKITTKTASYVKAFDIDAPTSHIVQPEGTIIRSGTITLINETET